jgi:biopolymer transport protein ExbD
MLARDDKSVFVRADASASMQDLLDVTDKLKEAGVDRVGLMSKPRETR